jgi:hypothetical protein
MCNVRSLLSTARAISYTFFPARNFLEGVCLERKVLGGSSSREKLLGAEASFLGAISQKREFSIGSERAGKRYINAKTPINSEVAILFASRCSYRVAAQPMELAKRINSDTASSEFKQVMFLTSPFILQIRLGMQGSPPALSDADSSFVRVC